ncbi:Niemann-Pick C1 protein, partial [Armadillidium nasatum]
MEYLPDFLSDNPHGTKCPEGGHPSYGSAVVIKNSSCNYLTNSNTCVGPNYFMAYHGVLKDSKDYTNALDEAYKLTDYMNSYIRNNSLTPHVEIFPYSVFYVFYEQYLDMWRSLAISLSVSAAAVFLVMYLITGFDLKSSVINLLVIVMIVVDIMAMMVPWNIQLNPISLVNLVMAIGISVEFCNHVTHTFVTSDLPTKVERATQALVYTGSSVFSGIAVTKFLGILVLFFANTQI